jgi:hypothetical protein
VGYQLPRHVPAALVAAVKVELAKSYRGRYLAVKLLRVRLGVSLKQAKGLAARVGGFDWSAPRTSRGETT